MADTVMNGLWLTVIDMTVVFIVLYVLALIIKAIKVIVAPFGNGNGPGGGTRRKAADSAPKAGETEQSAPTEVGSATADGSTSAETTAVITAALAVYLEKPAFVPVVIDGKARREESIWAIAGRAGIMRARDMAKRRATA